MFDAVVSWVSENFSQCAVLVADSIHRLTLQITRNLPPTEARAEAYRLGSGFLEENSDLFSEQSGCRFDPLRASSIETTPGFAEVKERLTGLFNADPDFASSIKSTATAFIQRRFRGRATTSKDRSRMMALSCQYLIEEMALFSCLVQMGWRIDVYPGDELPVLVEVSKGKYPDVPGELRSRVYIALKLKRVA